VTVQPPPASPLTPAACSAAPSPNTLSVAWLIADGLRALAAS
jgi:hypothetical protein